MATITISAATLPKWPHSTTGTVTIQFYLDRDGFAVDGTPQLKGGGPTLTATVSSDGEGGYSLAIPEFDITSTTDWLRPAGGRYSVKFILPDGRKLPWVEFTGVEIPIDAVSWNDISRYNRAGIILNRQERDRTYSREEIDAMYAGNSIMLSGAANRVFATPNGMAGAASLRALVAADIPSLAALYAALVHSHSGADITSGTINSARLPDLSGTYALAGHNHDLVYAAIIHTHTASQITDFNTAADARADSRINALVDSAFIVAELGFTPENPANKGAAGGYASLDGSSKVPLAQLDEVLALDDLTDVALSAPATGSLLQKTATTWQARGGQPIDSTDSTGKALVGTELWHTHAADEEFDNDAWRDEFFPNLVLPIRSSFYTKGEYAVNTPAAGSAVDGTSAWGNIFHAASVATNSGSMPVVAHVMLAKAEGAGAQAWAINPCGYVDTASTTVATLTGAATHNGGASYTIPVSDPSKMVVGKVYSLCDSGTPATVVAYLTVTAKAGSDVTGNSTGAILTLGTGDLVQGPTVALGGEVNFGVLANNYFSEAYGLLMAAIGTASTPRGRNIAYIMNQVGNGESRGAPRYGIAFQRANGIEPVMTVGQVAATPEVAATGGAGAIFRAAGVGLDPANDRIPYLVDATLSYFQYGLDFGSSHFSVCAWRLPGRMPSDGTGAGDVLLGIEKRRYEDDTSYYTGAVLTEYGDFSRSVITTLDGAVGGSVGAYTLPVADGTNLHTGGLYNIIDSGGDILATVKVTAGNADPVTVACVHPSSTMPAAVGAGDSICKAAKSVLRFGDTQAYFDTNNVELVGCDEFWFDTAQNGAVAKVSRYGVAARSIRGSGTAPTAARNASYLNNNPTVSGSSVAGTFSFEINSSPGADDDIFTVALPSDVTVGLSADNLYSSPPAVILQTEGPVRFYPKNVKANAFEVWAPAGTATATYVVHYVIIGKDS